jgi:hypothetical protein
MNNGVSLVGLDEAIASLRLLPVLIDRWEVHDQVAQRFEPRLRAATPRGYSGRLRDSVISETSDEALLVGYERDVETAGNPALDSVIRPQTKGRSVLRWASTDELSSVLEETFDAYSDEAVELMTTLFAEQIDGGT